MRPLAPAVFELRSTGVSILLCGLGAGVVALGAPEPGDLRAAGAGLAGSLLVLWVLGGARIARRASRLALPVKPRWRLESTAATLARVLLARTLPAVVIALGGATAAAPYIDGAAGAAAGVLTGAGLAALLCAQRVRAVERVRGRRMLHEPRLLRPLDRSSLYLEPEALAERPEGPPATSPWPAHRPPPRPQRAAIELEPANAAALHGVGVRSRPVARLSGEVAPRDPRGPAGRG
jgi:hypothetical protein